MSILVVGSIALDTVETPAGRVVDSPGGSALYFSAAASFFAPVRVVGVVGEDFDFSVVEFLRRRQVDLNGLSVQPGETFRWGGRYSKNLNHRKTLFTYLNVFENFQPQIPEAYCKSNYVFLANIDPELQMQVLQQVEQPRLSVLDTMNFWISGRRSYLEDVIRRVQVVILNDEEIRELTGVDNLYRAARELLRMGPRAVVIKKGEHGAVLIRQEGFFFCPAYPLEQVIDPTGAGDSFAGGFLGYLAQQARTDEETMRQAVLYGCCVASFNVEDFSFRKLEKIAREDIEQRVAHFKEMLRL